MNEKMVRTEQIIGAIRNQMNTDKFKSVGQLLQCAENDINVPLTSLSDDHIITVIENAKPNGNDEEYKEHLIDEIKQLDNKIIEAEIIGKIDWQKQLKIDREQLAEELYDDYDMDMRED